MLSFSRMAFSIWDESDSLFKRDDSIFSERAIGTIITADGRDGVLLKKFGQLRLCKFSRLQALICSAVFSPLSLNS